MVKVLILFILLSPLSYAENNEIDFVSFTIENDLVFSEDGGYSNGFIGAWGYRDLSKLDDQNLPSWIAFLVDRTYLTSIQDKKYSVSYSVGQFLQTAIDITISELVEEDAPYAGLLAWEGQVNAFDQHVSDELGLIFGFVGPISGVEQLQKVVHSLTDSDIPNGWEHQLENEFVFRVQAKRNWRLFDTVLPVQQTEFDIISGFSGGVGNLRSDIGTGLSFRWGQELTKSFSTASAMSLGKFSTPNNSSDGWYIFANISASYVANDIFINGNTFKDSHSVELIHDQYAFSTGAILNISSWSLLVSIIQISDEYETQTEPTRFGSITVSYNF